MTKLFDELKRRNVFRVGAAYVVVSWLVIQIINEVAEPLALPAPMPTVVIVLLGVGFPIALIIAWAFELTPDGLMKTDDVEVAKSVTARTGHRLNYLITGGLVLALGYFIWESRISEQSIEGDVPVATEVSDKSVAVLPFADLSENADKKWFVDGLTEEILNSLAALPELKVTARTSAFVFDGLDRNIGEIAEILGVAHVVEGSVRHIGGQLRVTAQLIRAEDGFHMWSETYDSTTENLFDVQTDVAEKIATTLDVFLDADRRERMFARGTRNVEAFEAYLVGRNLLTRVHAATTDKTLWDANVYLGKAMELDPNFGTPAILHHDAFAHTVLDGHQDPYIKLDGDPPHTQEEAMTLLLADLDQAAQNARRPDTRLIGELVREYFSPTWHRMPSLVARCHEVIDPDDLNFWDTTWLPNILALNGEMGLLRTIYEVRLKTDPLDPTAWSRMATLEIRGGNFDVARDLVKRGRAIAGDHVWLRDAALFAAVYSGNKEEVAGLLEADASSWHAPYLAATRGNYAEAARLADSLAASSEWPIAGLLLVYHEIGDSGRAAALTQRIDALPAGAVIFSRLITSYGNRLVIDLENASNFAARLREAGIDPASFHPMPRLSSGG